MVRELVQMPMIPCRDYVVLPGTAAHFDVEEKNLIAGLEKAMRTNQLVFVVLRKEPAGDDVLAVRGVGTICRMKQMMRMQNGVHRVVAQGVKAADVYQAFEQENYLVAEVSEQADEPADGDAYRTEAMNRIVREQAVLYASEMNSGNKVAFKRCLSTPELPKLLNQIIANLPITIEKRQQYLELTSLNARYQYVLECLAAELEISRIKKQIMDETKIRIDKNQKEFVLREQMKVIRGELGEDNSVSDADEFLEKTESLAAPEEIKEKLRKEIRKFKLLMGNSAENSVVRTYIETLLEFPWDLRSKELNDIRRTKHILERDHYGMEKVKERILEYLAVRKHTKKEMGSILCLVGPPGTGKTSIAKSVAESLGRKYVRLCLGGVRDEAEIRGHRRTYLGSMPGRIAAAMKQAGTKNPLMLLDEIDKLGNDFRGDPASALLEVLDGEQNKAFRDHYLEVPLDLSEVLFICTANTTDTIPRPLLDRMEIIQLSGYTEYEKFHIAKQYFVDKHRKNCGLKKSEFDLADDAIYELIRYYTKEAGVRQLERNIAALCRKKVYEKLAKENTGTSAVLRVEDIAHYLGKRKVYREQRNADDAVGIVRGLAWTAAGGDTLQIEVASMPGKGKLLLTGQLGDVMQESAKTALSYVRSIAGEFGVPDDYFETHDLHLHVPEGAVPKDGPSAGITMATAILSAATEKKIRANLAMTGEITLRGRVLPIGGVKEKLLAAKAAGIGLVLVPQENEPDVAELNEKICEHLTITFVGSMQEVLENAFAE
ncbi:MAG: endopeptidase La [Lachnospiraceae bacterium]|nr:endopeptidase La [Lachnospiraceae bacterium]